MKSNGADRLGTHSVAALQNGVDKAGTGPDRPDSRGRRASGPEEHGAVLILVLFVLTGLAVLTVQFSRDVLLDHALSSSTRSILASKPLMESGESLAAALLVRNSHEATPDHPREDWGQLPLFLPVLSAELQGASLSGTIEDENSRFPINALFYQRKEDRAKADAYARILTRMLTGLMFAHGYSGGTENAARSAEAFVQSIRQWGGQIPLDDTALKWYATRNPRRLPPGHPLLAPEELLLVRWPDMDELWSRRLLTGTETLPGLLDALTVWTQGPLNMNTAVPFVLAALVRDDRQAKAFASAIIRYRDNPDNELKDKWYDELLSYYGAEQMPEGVLDVRSRWYRLNLRVRQGARENSLTSVGWVTNRTVTWEYRTVR